MVRQPAGGDLIEGSGKALTTEDTEITEDSGGHLMTVSQAPTLDVNEDLPGGSRYFDGPHFDAPP